jgi:hypothetical protein
MKGWRGNQGLSQVPKTQDGRWRGTGFRVPRHVTRSRLGGKLLFVGNNSENFKENILWTNFVLLGRLY